MANPTNITLEQVVAELKRRGVSDSEIKAAAGQAEGESSLSIGPAVGNAVGRTAMATLGPAAQEMGGRVGESIVRDPKGAAETALGFAPAAGSIALPAAADALTGGLSAPANIALGGAGAALGEKVNQMGRSALGMEAAPPVELPFVGQVPRVPGVSPETSNMVEQGAINTGLDLFARGAVGMAKLGADAIQKGAVKYARPIGDALDKLGGFVEGSGEVLLRKPEIGKAGYYSTNKVKTFINTLSKSLENLETTAKQSWTGTAANLDAKLGKKADTLPVTQGIDRIKKAFRIKDTTPIGRSGPSAGQHVDPLVASSPRMVTVYDSLGVPKQVREDQLPTGFKTKSSGYSLPRGEERRVIKPGALGDPREVVEPPPPGQFKGTRRDTTPTYEQRAQQSKSSGFAGVGGQETAPPADIGRPEIRAVHELEETYNALLAEPTSSLDLGSKRTKTKFGLPELVELRQKADSFINYKSDVPDYAKSVFTAFRGSVDAEITKHYPQFKQADKVYKTMRESIDSVKHAFKVGTGTDAANLSYKEATDIENSLRRVTKRGELAKESLEQVDRTLGLGGYLLKRAESLSASGAKGRQFEDLIRPGFGIIAATAGGVGVAARGLFDASILKSLLASAGVLTATSPKVISAAVRGTDAALKAAKTMSPSLAAKGAKATIPAASEIMKRLRNGKQ